MRQRVNPRVDPHQARRQALLPRSDEEGILLSTASCSIVTKTVLGPGNVPIRVVSSEADHRDVALSEYEKMGISLWSLFDAEVLDRIFGRHGVPELTALTEFFTTPLMPLDVAERVARAVLLYSQGHFDESAHILVPRLEATIRTIARECGLATFREPQGAKPGGVRSRGTSPCHEGAD
jgi:hypothetical protein